MYLIDRDWCMISTRASVLLYTQFFQYVHVYSSICTVACGQSVRTEFCGVGLLSMLDLPCIEAPCMRGSTVLELARGVPVRVQSIVLVGIHTAVL